jgi:hypothetical protein
MQQIIKLEDTDDITSIRNRIDFALPHVLVPAGQHAGQGSRGLEKQRLLLVVPRKNKALQSLVNMKLLARTVKTKTVEIAIVSDDPTVRFCQRSRGESIWQPAKRQMGRLGYAGYPCGLARRDAPSSCTYARASPHR